MAIYINRHIDPRTAELQELAREEGFKLPISVELIIWFESHNCIVDLVTGKATRPTREENDTTVYAHTPSGKAVNHLLSDAQIEAELEDLREACADDEYYARGQW